MKPSSSLSLALLILAAARPCAAITNGEMDEDNLFPEVGAFLLIHPPIDDPDLPVPRIFGSGTLIGPTLMLTAGHVTEAIEFNIAIGRLELDDFRISFGVDSFDPATWREIDSVITHPDFAFEEPDWHDVGIVVLHDEVVGVEPAKLAVEGYLAELSERGALNSDHAPLLVVGYGDTLLFPPPTPVLRDGLRRFGTQQFLSLQGPLPWLLLYQNPATGDGGVGAGDSGGPVFWIDADGTRTLVALTSRGPAPGPALAYRVDIPTALDFIAFVQAFLE
jgi:hypothetical protein